MDTIATSDQASGEFKAMLIRLMTRQLYAETATAEIFGKAVSVAPTWRDKYLAAQFTAEEARHSQGLCDLLAELGEDPEAIVAGRPDAPEFWGIDVDDWLNIAAFNFTVDRAGSHQIMEYRESSFVPWADSQEIVLADEEDHYDSGVENLKEIATDPEKLRAFQEIFDRLLPITVKRAFGRLAGPENEFCLNTGLKRNDTETIVNRYLVEMRGHMENTGLVFPPLSAFDAVGCNIADSAKDILLSLQGG